MYAAGADTGTAPGPPAPSARRPSARPPAPARIPPHRNELAHRRTGQTRARPPAPAPVVSQRNGLARRRTKPAGAGLPAPARTDPQRDGLTARRTRQTRARLPDPPRFDLQRSALAGPRSEPVGAGLPGPVPFHPPRSGFSIPCSGPPAPRCIDPTGVDPQRSGFAGRGFEQPAARRTGPAPSPPSGLALRRTGEIRARLPAPPRTDPQRSGFAGRPPEQPAACRTGPAPVAPQSSGPARDCPSEPSAVRFARPARVSPQRSPRTGRRPGQPRTQPVGPAGITPGGTGCTRRRGSRPAGRRSPVRPTGAVLRGRPRGGSAAERFRAPRRATDLLVPAALSVVFLAALGCDARLHLYIHGGRETLLPGRAYGDALVTQGIVASVPPGRGLPAGEPARRFVLRHPARFPDWNGTLVIAAHRGLGGIRRGEDGEDLGTGETELDDLVGWWALDEGFAWAGFDRAGLGAGPEGYRLTEAFARLMYDQVRPRLAKDPERTILLGYGAGGGLARYAATAEEDTFDAALLVAATLGDPEAAARRREARLARSPDWPSLPATTPETAAPGEPPPALAAYAEAAGMPPEGHRFWPFHDALAAAHPVPVLPAPPALLLRPVVEVVGTLDDFVLPEVLSFRERTQQAGSAALHDLRLVPGAWRVDPEDDAAPEFRARAKALGLTRSQQAALATGAPLAAPVRRALTDLDTRLRAPP